MPITKQPEHPTPWTVRDLPDPAVSGVEVVDVYGKRLIAIPDLGDDQYHKILDEELSRMSGRVHDKLKKLNLSDEDTSS